MSDRGTGTPIILGGAKLVTPEATHLQGWIEVRGNILTAVQPGSPPRPADFDLSGHTIVPGFVDLHVHGGGGASFSEGPDRAAQAAHLHLRHGTTTTLASLVTAELNDMEAQIRALVGLVQDGLLAGIHLEGPWLSTTQCGAHSPTLLREPDPADVRRLLHAGQGTVKMVTIAPELKGALNAIREIVDAGAVAAIGHTDATYETVIEALHAGASVATHLFNAMRGFHHRQPGPALALLEDPRVRLELIADGKHLHPAVLASAIKTAGAHRILLVTDAMAAAGATDGDYSLGSSRVHVKSGVARAAVSGVIAGSTLTMDAAFRNVLATSGVPLSDVVLTACSNPADTLALSGVGRLRAGGHADLVVLDSRLSPTRVMRAGGWVDLSLGADPQLRERA